MGIIEEMSDKIDRMNNRIIYLESFLKDIETKLDKLLEQRKIEIEDITAIREVVDLLLEQKQPKDRQDKEKAIKNTLKG